MFCILCILLFFIVPSEKYNLLCKDSLMLPFSFFKKKKFFPQQLTGLDIAYFEVSSFAHLPQPQFGVVVT